MHNVTPPEDSPARRAVRRFVVPVVAIALIALAIWYLDSGRNLPLIDDNSEESLTFDEDLETSDGRTLTLGANNGPQAEMGKEAPGFTLLDLEGRAVNLSDFAGKTVLINFWASWCVPCRTEMPDLENAYRDRNASEGLVVLGINLQEARPAAKDFAEKYDLTFPVLLDSSGSVAKAYRLSGLPESWVVDPEGTLIQRKIGAFTKSELILMLDEIRDGIVAPSGRP